MDIYLRPHTSTSLSIYQRRSVFLFLFSFSFRHFQSTLFKVFGIPRIGKMAPSVIRELQRCWEGW